MVEAGDGCGFASELALESMLEIDHTVEITLGGHREEFLRVIKFGGQGENALVDRDPAKHGRPAQLR